MPIGPRNIALLMDVEEAEALKRILDHEDTDPHSFAFLWLGDMLNTAIATAEKDKKTRE